MENLNKKLSDELENKPFILGAVINPIKIYVKVKKCTTMHCENGNENGYITYQFRWAFLRKRGSRVLYTKIIGTGDVGVNGLNKENQ